MFAAGIYFAVVGWGQADPYSRKTTHPVEHSKPWTHRLGETPGTKGSP